MSLGDRVYFNSNYGTIRYTGSLSGKAGTWLGIEWDDPTRGRGDGSVNGNQYFTCRYFIHVYVYGYLSNGGN